MSVWSGDAAAGRVSGKIFGSADPGGGQEHKSPQVVPVLMA
jgi:hypothetical protein